MKKAISLAVLISAGLVMGTALAPSGEKAPAGIPDDVQAVFKNYCVRCHTGSKPPKGLSLIPSKVAAIIDAPSAGVPDLLLVNTKDPGSSYLLKKVRGGEGITGKPMPPGKALPAEDLKVLEAWIAGLK
jgi:mono/diheme cytochrome c family protein